MQHSDMDIFLTMLWKRPSCLLLFILPYTKTNSVNLALGKPAFQSSTLLFWLGPAPASKAVGGNNSTLFFDHSCSHTKGPEINPWWAVDMQWRHLVTRVVLTNRGDCCGDRLRNIRIGTTDVSPNATAPTPFNFDICASHDAAVAQGATQEFTCGGQGRYLVVLLKGAEMVLSLCEVQVFESQPRRTSRFRRTTESRLVENLLESLKVVTNLECAKECLMNIQCGSYNLRSVTSGRRTCELNKDISESIIPRDLHVDLEYSFYQIHY